MAVLGLGASVARVLDLRTRRGMLLRVQYLGLDSQAGSNQDSQDFVFALARTPGPAPQARELCRACSRRRRCMYERARGELASASSSLQRSLLLAIECGKSLSVQNGQAALPSCPLSAAPMTELPGRHSSLL